MMPSFVMAQSFCQDNPNGIIEAPGTTSQVTSNMGARNLSYGNNTHRGTDYGFGCGTSIKGPPQGCVNVNGGSSTPGIDAAGHFGYKAQFDCGNGIMLQYAHLNSANAYSPESNTITTGDTGSGGCHLDYIMTINNKVVDAQCATTHANPGGEYKYGNSSKKHNVQCPFDSAPNLCDNSVRQALEDHATQVFAQTEKPENQNYTIGDGSTGSGTTDSNIAENDTQPGEIVTQGTLGLDPKTTTSTGDPVPDPDPQPDPEEAEDPAPDPNDPYQQEASTLRCDNSTCITAGMIDTAAHNKTDDDKITANNDVYLLPKYSECKQPSFTNFQVYRQVPGKLEDYKAGFCAQQGCSYVRDGESGSCVK